MQRCSSTPPWGDKRPAFELARRGYNVTGLGENEFLKTKKGITYNIFPYKNTFDVALSMGAKELDKERYIVFQISKALIFGGVYVFDIGQSHEYSDMIMRAINNVNLYVFDECRYGDGNGGNKFNYLIFARKQ